MGENKKTNDKKANSTVAVSPEVALRLESFCKKLGITKKDFISLSLDFFDNIRISPKDSDLVLSWKKKSESISSMESDIREIKARTEHSNETIANIHGIITGSIADNLKNMLESIAIEQNNNTMLLEEIKSKKRHWWHW